MNVKCECAYTMEYSYRGKKKNTNISKVRWFCLAICFNTPDTRGV